MALKLTLKVLIHRTVGGEMLLELADQGSRTDTLMLDATHLKTYRTASSLGLKRLS